MKNSVEKSFAIVTFAICIFLLGRFYLSLNLQYARAYSPFIDWATNFVSTYLLAFGYVVLCVDFGWRRFLLFLNRGNKGVQQAQKSAV